MTAAWTGVEFENVRDLRIDKVCVRRGGSNALNGGPSATEREEREGGAIFFVVFRFLSFFLATKTRVK